MTSSIPDPTAREGQYFKREKTFRKLCDPTLRQTLSSSKTTAERKERLPQEKVDQTSMKLTFRSEVLVNPVKKPKMKVIREKRLAIWNSPLPYPSPELLDVSPANVSPRFPPKHPHQIPFRVEVQHRKSHPLSYTTTAKQQQFISDMNRELIE